MHLLFDALALDRRPSGTRTRLFGLLPELAKHQEVSLSILHGPDLDERDLSVLRVTEAVLVEKPPKGPLARARFWPRFLKEFQRTRYFDRFFTEAMPWPALRGMVGVVHDLRHLQAPIVQRSLARVLIRRSLERATMVHAVSETTRSEVLAAFPTLAGRTEVVRNGVDQRTYSPEEGARDGEMLAARGLRRGFVLTVGHFEDRKAPWLSVRAMAALERRGISADLVLVGRGDAVSDDKILSRAGSRPGTGQVRIVRDAEEDEMASLYRSASVLLAPSSLEGFGMVPLEALACGRAVIATDIPAHREVLGDLASYVPVGDAEAMALRLAEHFQKGEDSRFAIEARVARASGFSWRRSADDFLRSVRGSLREPS